ncbi:MAG TPA: phenylalanine--tRNA ligase beta subunit-related protein [Solirubrobacteraceae bacterium]
MDGEEPEVVAGWVDAEVRAEFPELRILSVELAALPGPSPPELQQRLRDMSDRFRGPQAVMLRQQPIPAAYRIFFRHIGLDPDVDRIPVEELAVERLKAGGFESRNRLDDALTVAVMETGLPVWALDAERVDGPLGIRQAREREPLGRFGGAPAVPGGRLVVADASGPLAVLFGDRAPGHGVTAETTRMLLFSVLVAGVPSIHAEEAFWVCEEILLDG